MTNILLVEDDSTLGETLKERLTLAGYATQWTTTCKEATKLFESTKFDLVIFDVGLPDGSGFELAKTFYKKQITFECSGSVEATTAAQLNNFSKQLQKYFSVKNQTTFNDWQEAFQILENCIKKIKSKQKTVLFYRIS